jgi:hypothetical protein
MDLKEVLQDQLNFNKNISGPILRVGFRKKGRTKIWIFSGFFEDF